MTSGWCIYNNYAAVLIWVLNVSLDLVYAEELCGLPNKVQYGLRLETEIFHLISKPGLKPCVLECMHRKRCVAFNYDKVSRTCELLDKTGNQESGKFVSRHGYYHGDISTWPMTEIGLCASRPCPVGKRCIDLVEKNFVCVITECIEPPIVQHAIITSSERGVKMTISYTCEAGYAMIGNPDITCKADGNWTSPTVQCKEPWISFGESMYLIGEHKKAWKDAKAYCESEQAKLVEIETQEENTFIKNTLIQRNGPNSGTVYWTGGNDLLVEGEFEWASSRQKIGYADWAPLEPYITYRNTHDCIEIMYRDAWNDNSCLTEQYFLCEKQ